MSNQKEKPRIKSSKEKNSVIHEDVTPPSKNQHPIEETIENFINSIEGFRASAPFIARALSSFANKHKKDFEKEVDKFGKIISEKEGKQKISFPPSRTPKALEIIDRLKKTTAAGKTLPSMFLLALVSQYDAFIANLLKDLFVKQPGLIFTSEKQVSFSEISEFNSIEEIKNSIIEKEVESIIRQSHAKQFDTMERLFKVKLKSELDIWPDFIEITERRNLLAHTHGIVSRQYVSICKKHGVAAEKIPSIGEVISFTPEYFDNTYNVLYEISLKLGHVLWRKILPEDISLSDQHYNRKCVQLIKAGNYDVAIKMLDFICDVIKKHSSENVRLFMEFNRCNAHRLAKRQERCIELLDAIDTSALGMEFRLAEAILRNRFDEAGKLMRQIGNTNKILNEFAYSDWPMFDGFRDSEQFLQAYKEAFGMPFAFTTSLDSDQAVENKKPKEKSSLKKQTESIPPNR